MSIPRGGLSGAGNGLPPQQADTREPATANAFAAGQGATVATAAGSTAQGVLRGAFAGAATFDDIAIPVVSEESCSREPNMGTRAANFGQAGTAGGASATALLEHAFGAGVRTVATVAATVTSQGLDSTELGVLLASRDSQVAGSVAAQGGTPTPPVSREPNMGTRAANFRDPRTAAAASGAAADPLASIPNTVSVPGGTRTLAQAGRPAAMPVSNQNTGAWQQLPEDDGFN